MRLEGVEADALLAVRADLAVGARLDLDVPRGSLVSGLLGGARIALMLGSEDLPAMAQVSGGSDGAGAHGRDTTSDVDASVTRLRVYPTTGSVSRGTIDYGLMPLMTSE